MEIIENILHKNPHVHIHDDKRASAERTLRSLIDDGRKMLHVVTDFDYTLTMFIKNGVTLATTFGVIYSQSPVPLPDGSLLSDRGKELYLKYNPIAIDDHMDVAEKIPYMIEWWRSIQNLLILSNLNKSHLCELVHQSNMELKIGAQKFITDLLHSQTPILIFSAGIGDIIEVFLQKEIPEFKHNHESSHIVSNFMQYDDNGTLKSFNDKIIHPLNKDEHAIHNTIYYQTILERQNVILLGDSLGDTAMIDGMNNLKNVLKIGFLNHSTPEKLETYKNAFDIVLCEDETFVVPNSILKVIQ
ncbi:unnamed protein product [Rotaria magnacalcarata]